jgi:hypothetical protein
MRLIKRFFLVTGLVILKLTQPLIPAKNHNSLKFNGTEGVVFLELYFTEVCSGNCVVKTDEDEAEYWLFESMIETSEVFSKSKVMICTFHGIWMAFIKDVLALLDESEHGKIYGSLHHTYKFIFTNSFQLYTRVNMYKFV